MTRPLWKILGPAREAIHGGIGVWPEPGEWLEVEGPIHPCRHGLHLCRDQDLIRWARVGAVVWTVETTGPIVVDDDCKVVAGRARLVEPVGRITGRVLRLTAADIAESVAYLHGHDPGCMEAIRVARLCAHGLATAGEAEAARSAAWDAVRAASEEAVRESAREAAEEGSLEAALAAADAAWAAAWAAAWGGARAAVDAAAWDAVAAAAWDAARAAAGEAARAAKWSAARWDALDAAQKAAREAAWVGHGGILLDNLIRWGQQ